jgi:hypothetical protein
MSTQNKLDNLTLQIEYSKQEFREITHMTHQSNCAILQLLEIIERQNSTIEILKGHVKTLESERLERERDHKANLRRDFIQASENSLKRHREDL